MAASVAGGGVGHHLTQRVTPSLPATHRLLQALDLLYLTLLNFWITFFGKPPSVSNYTQISPSKTLLKCAGSEGAGPEF